MAEISSPASTNADGGMLWDFWYPALRSHQVRGSDLRRAMLLDVPLVIGRDTHGKPFALRDVCPHRGMPLSCGQSDGETVECSYHGWRFDARTGQCRGIPSITADSNLRVDRIYAGSFPCEERDGYVWVYMTPPNSSRLEHAPTPAPELPKFSERYRMAHLSAEMPVHVDHGVIGLMDPAHGPFVHQSWWWRSGSSIHVKQKQFEPIPQGFRMTAHAPSANSAPYKLLGVYGQPVTTTIDFVLPNRRYETIRCGDKWFSSLTTVTPVTATTSRIDVVAAWNIFYHVPFVPEIAKAFGKRFVEQDRQTMVEQARGLRFNPALMLIDDADRPAKWYFALKQARLQMAMTGEFEHPLKEPVTLHWRS